MIANNDFINRNHIKTLKNNTRLSIAEICFALISSHYIAYHYKLKYLIVKLLCFLLFIHNND